jgi:Na+-transporting methylmalonyl-CoA/oxaloacetate decarboxylase beta subunit
MLVLVSQALSGVWGGIGALREDTGNTLQNLAATLLGSDAGPGAYTSQFGAIGLLLLAALVAAIVILGGERK